MIEAINGILTEKSNLKAVISINGLEFKLTIPISTYDKLPETGEKVRLFTELVIGEKSSKLYGFFTKGERTLFNELRKISKIGAQTAITILSNVSVSQFYKIVHDQDKNALIKIPGIGKKTALNIIVELSQKLPENNDSSTSSVIIETIDTLVSLGFPKSQAENTAKSAYEELNNPTLEKLIKESLKRLGKNAR